jgi:hypothetical protein
MNGAELLHRERADVAGMAGLAYQAIDLASKALTEAIDGSDAGSHRRRMRRTATLVDRKVESLDFLWSVRQREFYGDAEPGEERQLPTVKQIADAVVLARSILTDIEGALRSDNS